MGLLDTIGAFAGGASQGDNAKVVGGLMTTLQSHPGGLQGVLSSFEQNGLGNHAAALANGEAPALTPDEIGQGLAGTGLIEKTAEHAGVSPDVVQMVMTTALPLVMSHLASTGGAGISETSESELGEATQSLLKRFL
jgi:uncharacterized protein YidB (DUF937 family)